VVAGPANTYSHYIATIEEYGVQRYEGASTIYGPCVYHFPSALWNQLISFVKTPWTHTLTSILAWYLILQTTPLAHQLRTPLHQSRHPRLSLCRYINISYKTFFRGLNSSLAYLKLPVVFDAPPPGSYFGKVLVDVNTTSYQAGDTVFAIFVGANPRVSGISLFQRLLYR
jgi:neutral ceramidase